MPVEYWTWDEKTKLNIDIWADKTTNIKSKVVGQPYLEYWKIRNSKVLIDEKVVFYSLQLLPLTECLITLLLN